jgi:hypothetical protein
MEILSPENPDELRRREASIKRPPVFSSYPVTCAILLPQIGNPGYPGWCSGGQCVTGKDIKKTARFRDVRYHYSRYPASTSS